jgi:hypothetical protein
MPLALTDEERDVVMVAAAAHTLQRGKFLQELANAPDPHPTIGPGILHRAIGRRRQRRRSDGLRRRAGAKAAAGCFAG